MLKGNGHLIEANAIAKSEILACEEAARQDVEQHGWRQGDLAMRKRIMNLGWGRNIMPRQVG